MTNTIETNNSEKEQTHFRAVWVEHVSELNRLKWNLNEEESKELDQIKIDLLRLVDRASAEQKRHAR